MTTPERVRLWILRTVRSEIVHSTGIIAVGMGLRVISQTIAFLIVSRFMGATEFGAFVSVVAVVAIIGAFSGWGAELLIIRTVARSPSELARAWGSGLAFFAVSAPPLALTAILIVPLVTKSSIPREIIFYVVMADIVFARINVIGSACYRAINRPVGAAFLQAGFIGARLVAALLWAGVGSYSARSWTGYYCGASAVFAIVSLLFVWRDFGRPVWQVAWEEWRDGFQFCLLDASFVASGQIATPIVALLSNLATAGIYGAAIRIVDAAVIPFYAFMFSVLPRFFRSGASGMQESLKLALHMLPAGLAAAFVGSLCVVLIAPVAPSLLGHSYIGTGQIIILLAPVPMLYGAYLLAADALISSQHVRVRVLLQCIMPVVNLICCVLMVPQFGAVGAAIAVLISNASLATAAWILAIRISRSDTENRS